MKRAWRSENRAGSFRHWMNASAEIDRSGKVERLWCCGSRLGTAPGRCSQVTYNFVKSGHAVKAMPTTGRPLRRRTDERPTDRRTNCVFAGSLFDDQSFPEGRSAACRIHRPAAALVGTAGWPVPAACRVQPILRTDLRRRRRRRRYDVASAASSDAHFHIARNNILPG